MITTDPDHLVAAPGEVLEDWLDERRMSQRELADRTSKSEKFISQLINGKATLTADTAHDLELVTGVGADTWLRMEGSYRAKLRRQEAVAAADAADSPVEATLLKFLRDNGLVTAPARAKGEQLVQVFTLLGVSSHDALRRLTRRHAAAFRVSASFALDPVATEVVIALAHRQAAVIPVERYDPELVMESLHRLRELTRSAPVRGALEARALLGAAGVALVFLPNVPKSHCNGVTLWGPRSPIVAITDRGRREDIFWFTLFHELSHVIDGERDAIYLDGPGGQKEEAERRADEFATETLVPRTREHLLGQIKSFSDLARVARELGVGEGVVIGQLHHRKLKLPSWGQSRLAKLVVVTE